MSHIGGILDTGVHDCTNSTLRSGARVKRRSRSRVWCLNQAAVLASRRANRDADICDGAISCGRILCHSYSTVQPPRTNSIFDFQGKGLNLVKLGYLIQRLRKGEMCVIPTYTKLHKKDHHQNHHYSICDTVTNSHILILEHTETSETLSTFETFDQSYEKTWPDHQKDNDKDNDKCI